MAFSEKKMQYLVAKVYFKTLFAISMSCYITGISLNQVCDENYFFNRGAKFKP